MTRRVAAALAALLVFAACGSSGSAKPSSSSPVASTSTTAPGNAGDYVEAVYSSLLAGSPTAPKDDMRCVAQAIVSGVGVDRLRAAGVTVADLRNPEFEPPPTIADAMGTEERVAFATRLQSCDFGRIIGTQLALQFAGGGDVEPAIVGCFGRGFEGAAARRMIAGLMLNDLSIPDANQFAGLTVGCIGLATLIANDVGVDLSGAEEQCINRAGRTDTTFLRRLAEELRTEQLAPRSARARLGVPVFRCLTRAHRVAVARS
jgi:hypothetical protein